MTVGSPPILTPTPARRPLRRGVMKRAKYLLRDLLPATLEVCAHRLLAGWKAHRYVAQHAAMVELEAKFTAGLAASGAKLEAAVNDAAEAAEDSRRELGQALLAKEAAEAEAARLRGRQEVLREELREGVGEIDHLRKKLEARPISGTREAPHLSPRFQAVTAHAQSELETQLAAERERLSCRHEAARETWQEQRQGLVLSEQTTDLESDWCWLGRA